MKQAADVDSDIFYARVYNVLKGMLSAADTDPDYRKAVHDIGNDVKADGAWRARIKNSYGLDDSNVKAWDSIATFIDQNSNGKPWWYVLDYADGKQVPDDVKAFFLEPRA